MWLYYQTKEDGKQAWQLADDSQEDVLRKGVAYHISIYHLDKNPDAESTDANEIRYKGDLWLDIDHKPGVNESIEDALQRSIDDLNKLIKWFEDKRLSLEVCQFYASGSKGFHIRIPGAVLGASKSYKDLPKIHKAMVSRIIVQTGMIGVDLQLYCAGKGRLLRVENKERANGKFKVIMSVDEVRNMSPERYLNITSYPRDLKTKQEKCALNNELSAMYADCKEEIEYLRKTPFQAMAREELEPFADKPPRCVDWLVEHTNIHAKADKFNTAKMSLARYLVNAPITQDQSDDIVSAMINNWDSDTNVTEKAKERAIQAALKSCAEYGFDCGFMKKTFSKDPCSGCILAAKASAQSRGGNDDGPIIATEEGYLRNTEKMYRITNFTLVPVRVFLLEEKGELIPEEVEFEAHRDGKRIPGMRKDVGILNSDWMSATAFKRAVSKIPFSAFTGTDNDVQYLREMLTRLPEDIKQMKKVRSLGIQVIDGLPVWVEKDKSIGANLIEDIVKWNSREQMSDSSYNHVTINYKAIGKLDVKDALFNDTFDAMLDVNEPEILAPIIGWLAACWLKPFCTVGTDKHFPFLQIYGPAGVGKTESTSALSILGGAVYGNGTSPVTASRSTMFAITEEARMTTSIPRILDEFNQTKMDPAQYKGVREVVKCSVSGNAISKGFKTADGFALDAKEITSPIITCATNENIEDEIVERTVPVFICKQAKEKGTHKQSFRKFRNHKEALLPFIVELMWGALEMDRSAWVRDKLEDYEDTMTYIDRDRVRKCWAIVITGYDFLLEIGRKVKLRQELIDKLEGYRSWLLEDLRRKGESADNIDHTEAEIAMDYIGLLATTDDKRGSTMINTSYHYRVEGEYLHLSVSLAFMVMNGYLRTNQLTIEYAGVAQFLTAIKAREWYISTGTAPNVSSPRDWVTLSLPLLEKAGVNIDRFSRNETT